MREVSTVTAKGQTTVPAAVRRALGVQAGDQVLYRLERGVVTLQRVGSVVDDPVVGSFLDFLEADMGGRPDRLRPLTAEHALRLAELTRGVEVDIDAAIHGDVAL